MSLAPAEEQALAQIESRLRRSDPKLALMLKALARRPLAHKGPARERISPWRPHPRRLRLAAVALVVLALGVLWGIVLANVNHPAPLRACGSVVMQRGTCPAAHATHRRPAASSGLPVLRPGK